MSVPEDRRYCATHQWAKPIPAGGYAVGITDYAQNELGDLMFVELPELGKKVGVGDSCATLESVKTASDVAAPLAGTITAINDPLKAHPETLNQAPYDHWIVIIQPDQEANYAELLSPQDYLKLL